MRKYIISLVILLCIGVLPSFFSTQLGKNLLLSLINRSKAGTLQIETLSLGWVSSQKAEGIAYKTEDLDFSCSSLFIKHGLLGFLWKPYQLDILTLSEPKLVFFTDKTLPTIKEPEVKNSSLATSYLKLPILKESLFSFLGKINVEEGFLKIMSQGKTLAVFSPICCLLELGKEPKKASLCLQTDILQEQQEKGSLFIDAVLEEETLLHVSLKALATHLPVASLDKIVALVAPSYQGLGTEFFGSYIDLNCQGNLSEDLCEVDLSFSSDRTKAKLQLASQNDIAKLSSPALFQVTFSPTLFPSLKAPVSLMLTLNELSFPLKDWKEASFKGLVTSSSYVLSQGAKAKLEASFSSDRLSDKILSRLNVISSLKKLTTETVAEGVIENPLSALPNFSFSLRMQKTPTFILADFFSGSEKLEQLLGNEVEGTLSLQGTLEKSKGELFIQSPNLTLPTTFFSLESGTYFLAAPTSFTYLLTPLLAPFLTSSVQIQTQVLEASFQKHLVLSMKSDISLMSLKEVTIEPITTYLTINSLDKISLSAASPTFTLDSFWQLKEKILTLKKDLTLSYVVKEKDLKMLSKDFPYLTEDMQIHLTVDPTSLPLDGDLKQIQATAHLKIPKAFFNYNSQPVSLENVEAITLFNGKKETLSFSMNTSLAPSTQISIQGALEGVLSEKEPILASLKADLSNLSVSLIETVLKNDTHLTSLLGDTLSASFALEKKEKIQVSINSPLLSLKGALKIKDSTLLLVKEEGPLQFSYELTQEGYQNLLLLKEKNIPFNLKNKALFTGIITKLTLPYDLNTFKPDIEDMRIQASFNANELVFARVKSLETVSLEQIQLSLQKGGRDQKINALLEAKTASKGHLQLQATLDSLDVSKAKTTLDLQIHEFPSSFLDIAMLRQDDFFKTLLGESFNTILTVSLQEASGPLLCHFSSPEAQVYVSGELTSGILRLKENAKAKISLTPKASRLFLQKGGSSIDSLSTLTPITLEIQAQNFSLPLLGFSLNRITIPDIEIKLGKILCQSKGNIDFALKLLKAKETKEVELWFAPIDLHIIQGVIDVERTEILIGKMYDLAIWGPIDLPQNYVNMTLGLTAQTLSKAFALKNLPKDYVLKIPMRGPLNDVQIDASSATAKIAALMLWKNKAVQKSLGPFGGILDIIPPPGGDGNTPPAKHPFPWE